MILKTHGALSHIDFEPVMPRGILSQERFDQYFLNQNALSPSALGFIGFKVCIFGFFLVWNLRLRVWGNHIKKAEETPNV